jgi:squalene-associated FAD-dependent desaturase
MTPLSRGSAANRGVPRASEASRANDAIVIGGGFAGLAAATLLAERGARVLVLEARPAPGGRATAFTDPATGERVDNGQHVLLGCYRDTFRFLDRIGATSHVEVQDRLTVDMIDRDGRSSRLRCPRLPPPLNLLAGVMTWRALSWRDRIAAIRIGARPPFTGRPDETVRQWLVRHHQTPRLVEMLWEPLAVAALNESIDAASAEPFERSLAEMLGTNPRDASIALPLKPLDELYVVPACEYLEKHGGEVRTNAPARIQFATRGAGEQGAPAQVIVRQETFTAAAIICAVPWFALPELFLDPPDSLGATLDAAARTAASPIVTVNLWFDRVVTDHVLVGLPGRTMQWVFDKRRVFGEQASHLSLVSSGAERIVSLTNEELIELATREVRGALPAARDAAVRRAVVVREKRATFSVAPGQPQRPNAKTPISGLFLAGDWIDTGLPATIEGAVRSGHEAASLALSD